MLGYYLDGYMLVALIWLAARLERHYRCQQRQKYLQRNHSTMRQCYLWCLVLLLGFILYYFYVHFNLFVFPRVLWNTVAVLKFASSVRKTVTTIIFLASPSLLRRSVDHTKLHQDTQRNFVIKRFDFLASLWHIELFH